MRRMLRYYVRLLFRECVGAHKSQTIIGEKV